MASTRAERWLFQGLALAVLTYVLARAALIPLVHDEATSFLAYAQSGRFLPFASMWDANNHYFNSALGAVGYKLFGLHLLALRWASALSYLLFAWSAWRIGGHVVHLYVRWCLWGALLLCPFLLDFFSLYRGYGPAMAFLLFAVQALLHFARHRERRPLIAALLGMAVANGFLLALVPLWGVMLAVLWPLVSKDRKLLYPWLVLGVLPFLGAGALAVFMAHMGLLYQGGLGGFVEVTAGSLMHRMFGITDGLVAWAAVLFVAMLTVAMARPALRSRDRRAPGVIIASLLFGECALRVIAANAAGINYGEDRTALHTVVLAVLVTAFAVDAWAVRKPWSWLLALPLLALPLRTLQQANMDRTVLWPEQSIPDRFVLFVRALQERSPRPLVVGMHRHAGLPWSLQCRMLGFESDGNAHSWPNGIDDVRVAWARSAAEHPGYAVVDSAPDSQLLLLVRREPVRTRLLLDTVFAASGIGPQRILSFDRSAKGSDLLLELSGALRSARDPLDLRLVITEHDSAGSPLRQDLVFLNTRREKWSGETWRCIRHLPSLPSSRHVEVELWAAEETRYELTEARVILRAVLPDQRSPSQLVP